MMSVVQIDGLFCFQTDRTLPKYHQIISNPHVALCIDNIQIEGICEEMGHPLQCAPFREAFQACFKGSFDAYSSLENERVFSIKPLYIERWVYQNGVPYIETFDVKTQKYTFDRYLGV